MNHRNLILTALLISTVPPAIASGQSLSVEEIVGHTNVVSYYQGIDGRAQVDMTIVDGQDRERHREFTILRRDDQPEGVADDEFQGDQKLYVYFHRPPM